MGVWVCVCVHMPRPTPLLLGDGFWPVNAHLRAPIEIYSIKMQKS